MKGKAIFGMVILAAGLALLARQPGAGGNCIRCVALAPNLMAALSSPPMLSLPYPQPPPPEEWQTLTAGQRLANVRSRLLPKLHEQLAASKAELGDAAFIRVFKETKELELWLQTGGQWTLFRTYPIAVFSGTLGPKTREGDLQAPEGFYGATAESLNPASKYHLSFNIRYPNAYDRHHARTGSLIMIHGDQVSVGCFAMTDPLIEEIYLITEAALQAGQRELPVHVFPFRMTDQRMAAAAGSPHLEFWRELRFGYDWFETRKDVPAVEVQDGRHAFDGSL